MNMHLQHDGNAFYVVCDCGDVVCIEKGDTVLTCTRSHTALLSTVVLDYLRNRIKNINEAFDMLSVNMVYMMHSINSWKSSLDDLRAYGDE